eukprot:9473023-Pyramimonas_sp.AAC.1
MTKTTYVSFVRFGSLTPRPRKGTASSVHKSRGSQAYKCSPSSVPGFHRDPTLRPPPLGPALFQPHDPPCDHIHRTDAVKTRWTSEMRWRPLLLGFCFLTRFEDFRSSQRYADVILTHLYTVHTPVTFTTSTKPDGCVPNEGSTSEVVSGHE